MAEAPTLSGVLKSVCPLVEAGASLHWLVPFQKRPILDEWSAAPRLSFSALKASYRQNANIGIRLGEPSKIGDYYLHLFDIDIRKPELEAEVWAQMFKLVPEARSLPSVISGSGGASRHLYFLSDKPFRKTNLAKSDAFELVWNEAKQRHEKKRDWMIDLYGTGVQAVLPPSIHPDTGLPYIWERHLNLGSIEFGIGPIIDSPRIEQWGLRTAEALDSDDEDDLETLFAQTPLDLTEEEIEKTLADLPADWVDDYWMWVDVGMALHHQFEGSDEGLSIWCDWSSSYERYSEQACRDKWSSLAWKPRHKNDAPKTFRSLIQAANANRLSDEHDFDLDDDPFDAAPAATGTAIALTSRYSLDDILNGDDVPPAPKVEPLPEILPLDPEWKQRLHLNEDGDLKSTSHNVGLIVANDIRLGGVIAFNEFLQEIVVRKSPHRVKKRRESAKTVVNLDSRIWRNIDPINGSTFTDSHENAIRMLIEAPTTQGGYGIKVSDRDLRTAVDVAAHTYRFHPVKIKLEQSEWDGVERMNQLFVRYLGAEDTPYHRETAVKTLVAAVARIYEPGHKFDYVPILEGVQGKRKSTFIETLAFGWFAELEGDLHDRKGMVEKMQGAWILEIPELQGFSKAEVTTIKGLVSARQDKVRMAYARRAVIFYRQCVFMGSTNEDEYLRDPTGARRFWPIHCAIEGEIDITLLRHNLPQIWAEALHTYRELRKVCRDEALPLYLNSKDAAEEALLIQSSRSQELSEQSLSGQITAWLDEPIEDGSGFDDLDPDAPKVYRQETCMAQVWVEMMGRHGVIPHVEAMKIGAALKATGWKRSSGPIQGLEINRKYGKTRVYSRT